MGQHPSRGREVVCRSRGTKREVSQEVRHSPLSQVPRICDPLMFVRTSRRAPPSRRSRMCPTCLGSVTFSCCFYLTQSHALLYVRTMVYAFPRPPSPPPRLGAPYPGRRHGYVRTYVRRRCSENESAWISGNGGHRYHDMVSIL